MANHNLILYITVSRSAGSDDETIKNHLIDAGWSESDVISAFKDLEEPSFQAAPILRTISKNLNVKPAVKYLFGAIIITLLIFGIYKFLIPAKEMISQFEMTAKIADAAGINPDSSFVLKSTANLAASVVEKYLVIEPKTDVKINKISSGTGSTFEIKPKENLAENSILAVKIDPGPIADKTYSWAFQVKAPFQVISTLPRDKGTAVPLNTGIEIKFNREKLGAFDEYFEILPAVKGRFEYYRDNIVFVPLENLKGQAIYSVVIKKGFGIEGSADKLTEDKIFRFETISSDGNYYRNYDRPSLDFAKMFWEFKPNAQPNFEVQANKITQVPVKVYKFENITKFLDAYKSSLKTENIWSYFGRYIPYQPTTETTILNTTLTIESDKAGSYLKLPEKLAEGSYLIDLKINDRSEQAWFQVSPVASYLSLTSTKGIVWLRSLTDNSATINGAKVFFNGNELGSTGNDGVAMFNTPSALITKLTDDYFSYASEPPNFLTVRAGGSEFAIPIDSKYGYYRLTPPDQWWKYLSLDKTIYRPNDSLKFWGVVRQRSGSDMRGHEVTMQLSDTYWYDYWSRQNVTVYGETKAKIDDFYAINGNISFSGLKPGLYQLSIKDGDELIISESVTVETYIAPAYKITIEPDKKAVFAGDDINFKVKAKFFDGTPLGNLDIKYQGDASGAIRLNKNGEGSIRVTTVYSEKRAGNYSSYYSYWPHYFQVTVMPAIAEEGEIMESSYVMVYGPNIKLDVTDRSDGTTAKMESSLHKIDLSQIEKSDSYSDASGAPVANYPVSVEMTEVVTIQTETGRIYDPIGKTTHPIYNYSTEYHQVRTETIYTDASGKVNFTQALEQKKNYRIIFTVRDEKGRPSQQTRNVYGYSNTYQPYDYNYYYSTIFGVDLANQDKGKYSYKIGDKITLQMQDHSGKPLPSGANDFLYYNMINGLDAYQLSGLPDYNSQYSDRFIPNVRFVGVWFSGERFYDSYTLDLSLDKNERDLDIKVNKNKETYKPGEEVKLNLNVADRNGKPKEAEVSVVGIDEAVFSLNPDEKDITSSIYSGIYSSLITRSSHINPDSSGLGMPGGAEGGGCFVAGTRIKTADDEKNIEDVRIGDMVLTKDSPSSTRLVRSPVLKISSHISKGYLVINDRLKVTTNHRLFVNNDWLKAGQVKVGDRLFDLNNREVIVEKIEFNPTWTLVYNFEVEKQHTYFAEDLYVHNEEKGGASRGDFEELAVSSIIKTGTDGKGSLSFQLPDNITSWRLNVQAVTKDLFAGKATEFIPVSLPFFVDAALNRTYLAGDNLVVRARVSGTGNIPATIDYQIESDVLASKKINRQTSSVSDFDLGKLTAPGKYKIKISASANGMSDSITRDINVVDSYFTKGDSTVYDLASSLTNIMGNATGATELIFASRDRGRLYPQLQSLRWSWGSRVDQKIMNYMAGDLLNKYFDEKNELATPDLQSFQTSDGGIALLPYSDNDLDYSARFTGITANMDVGIDRKSLKEYFHSALIDKKADLKRATRALYGLAAFREPVLVTIQNLKKDANLKISDKIYLALAMDIIGAKGEARDYYRDEIKPKLFTKSPLTYLENADDGSDTYLDSAMIAQLSASLQEPETEELGNYLFQSYSKFELANIEKAGYLSSVLPTLRGGDVSFSYNYGSVNKSITLKSGQIHRLKLTADDLKNLRFEKITGSVGMISYYERKTNSSEIKTDSDISVSRTYSVNNAKTNQFLEGDVVKVTLSPSGTTRALRGQYQVIDYLPSGLRAITRLYSQPMSATRCYPNYPVLIEDQKITFIDYLPKISSSCKDIYYYARIVSKGTYKAEPVLIQSKQNASSLNLSSSDTITVR